MIVYYSVMASKSYREDTWEIVEDSFEYRYDNIPNYLYGEILTQYVRFNNLIIKIYNN